MSHFSSFQMALDVIDENLFQSFDQLLKFLSSHKIALNFILIPDSDVNLTLVFSINDNNSVSFRRRSIVCFGLKVLLILSLTCPLLERLFHFSLFSFAHICYKFHSLIFNILIPITILNLCI